MNVWLRTPMKENQSRNIWVLWVQIPLGAIFFFIHLDGNFVTKWQKCHICVINKNLEYWHYCQLRLFCENPVFSTSPIRCLSISVWWYLSLSMNVWLRTPTNETKSRNIWTCSSFNPARNVCKYVVILFFAFHCVDANTCQLN